MTSTQWSLECYDWEQTLKSCIAQNDAIFQRNKSPRGDPDMKILWYLRRIISDGEFCWCILKGKWQHFQQTGPGVACRKNIRALLWEDGAFSADFSHLRLQPRGLLMSFTEKKNKKTREQAQSLMEARSINVKSFCIHLLSDKRVKQKSVYQNWWKCHENK